MGCGLRKLRQSEDSSPGKIYSTLKRPQVETKTGVAYTYRHLDFLVGKDDGTSTLQLSSVRELPAQLLELYQQGFTLAAVHPFVHPCGPEPAKIQRQLYRTVLIRVADSAEKSQLDTQESCHLRLEECLSAEQFPSSELIQGYVKKIQDAADQGIMFVGFIQEPERVRLCLSGHSVPEELSLSLHSSPSSIHSSRAGQSPSPLETPASDGQEQHEAEKVSRSTAASLKDGETLASQEGATSLDEASSVPGSPSSQADSHQQDVSVPASPVHNNNDAKVTVSKEKPRSPALRRTGVELFALYNHPCSREGLLKYYTVKVPLKVQPHDDGTRSVEANWLDHMTQHFNNGASLVDGYFHLGSDTELAQQAVESVFIFQEGREGDSATAYDAIVVEQWTVIDGVQVKTDYIPLLQSLAMYGWRLTCVLPTPITKTNSDGSLSTKQIVFLQRPVLPRKKRDSKNLIFKTRNKSSKNSVKDAPKGKKKKNSPQAENELDDQKIGDGLEKTSKEESMGVNNRTEIPDSEVPEVTPGQNDSTATANNEEEDNKWGDGVDEIRTEHEDQKAEADVKEEQKSGEMRSDAEEDRDGNGIKPEIGDDGEVKEGEDATASEQDRLLSSGAKNGEVAVQHNSSAKQDQAPVTSQELHVESVLTH
ncbi:raftlin isoform X2 [Denticeps clupeoides]|uniref:raftlin isoform X2 n=1 Tax=Denticeps clupeoides TaxID=299321 RepID=UPI0010A57F0B|nr:raftlin isoform X2 [Denticeps clupeoides]